MLEIKWSKEGHVCADGEAKGKELYAVYGKYGIICRKLYKTVDVAIAQAKTYLDIDVYVVKIVSDIYIGRIVVIQTMWSNGVWVKEETYP